MLMEDNDGRGRKINKEHRALIPASNMKSHNIDTTYTECISSLVRSFRVIFSRQNRLGVALLCLVVFTVSKFTTTSSSRSDFSATSSLSNHELNQQQLQNSASQLLASRNNCQIIYILGVEGSMHHGFSTVFDALARQQVDPSTGQPYDVKLGGMQGHQTTLKAALMGFGNKNKAGVGNPALVQRILSQVCPNDGKRHVIIEDSSFPCGHEDDPRTYRVHRQSYWKSASSMEQIANDNNALNHPTNLYEFYEGYSPYADVKFVVLHRPFLETIASHHVWDGGAEGHSNVIRGFMLLLRRFVDSHTFDPRTGQKLWTMVCIERIAAKFYNSEQEVHIARQHVLEKLASFMSWPTGACPACFDDWRESTKNYAEVLGDIQVALLEEHKKTLEGIWPPVEIDAIAEQHQCQI